MDAACLPSLNTIVLPFVHLGQTMTNTNKNKSSLSDNSPLIQNDCNDSQLWMQQEFLRCITVINNNANPVLVEEAKDSLWIIMCALAKHSKSFTKSDRKQFGDLSKMVFGINILGDIAKPKKSESLASMLARCSSSQINEGKLHQTP